MGKRPRHRRPVHVDCRSERDLAGSFSEKLDDFPLKTPFSRSETILRTSPDFPVGKELRQGGRAGFFEEAFQSPAWHALAGGFPEGKSDDLGDWEPWGSL